MKYRCPRVRQRHGSFGFDQQPSPEAKARRSKQAGDDGTDKGESGADRDDIDLGSEIQLRNQLHPEPPGPCPTADVNKTLRHREACKEVQLNFNGGFTYFLLVNPVPLGQTLGVPAENRGAVVDSRSNHERRAPVRRTRRQPTLCHPGRTRRSPEPRREAPRSPRAPER